MKKRILMILLVCVIITSLSANIFSASAYRQNLWKEININIDGNSETIQVYKNQYSLMFDHADYGIINVFYLPRAAELYAYDVLTGDFNGDGNEDVLLITDEPGYVKFYLLELWGVMSWYTTEWYSESSSSFPLYKTDAYHGTYNYEFYAQDIDQDGKDDVVGHMLHRETIVAPYYSEVYFVFRKFISTGISFTDATGTIPSNGSGLFGPYQDDMIVVPGTFNGQSVIYMMNNTTISVFSYNISNFDHYVHSSYFTYSVPDPNNWEMDLYYSYWEDLVSMELADLNGDDTDDVIVKYIVNGEVKTDHLIYEMVYFMGNYMYEFVRYPQ